MAKLTAIGSYFGMQVTAEVIMESGSPIIELNGKYIESVQTRFAQLLNHAPAIGGTYHPPKDSMMAAYSVLESMFFDDRPPVAVIVDGDIGMIPYDKNHPDRVY